MRLAPISTIIACLSLTIMLPLPADATPVITCHCFIDRSYDPAQPAMADPYFLATAQNSFFAIVFSIDKKSVVMKKQGGTASDDLWIAYWIASKSGTAADSLLQARLKTDTWKNVITPLRLSPKSLGVQFSSALTANMPANRLSEAVVDEIFLKERLLAAGDLAALRRAGANNQELIIATVIATRTRQPAQQLYHEVKSASRTWGSLLSAAKIDTKNMQQEIAAILKLQQR